MRNYSQNVDLSCVPIDGLMADKNRLLEECNQYSSRIDALNHDLNTLSKAKWEMRDAVRRITRELRRRK